jgi:heme/copper-type cytochrome/quinol oxidase subunit 4
MKAIRHSKGTKPRRFASSENACWNTRTWWAGFVVLLVSLTMLALCTFVETANRELVEIWKVVLFASLAYVVGIPVGTEIARE